MLTENGSVVVVGSGTGTNNTLVKWLNGPGGTIDDSTVLSENAFGVLVANTKFISSADGQVQLNFGSGNYFALTTDAGAYLTSYIFVQSNMVELASVAGAGLVLKTTGSLLAHNTLIQLTAPKINASGLSAYANDATAGVAGLVTGDLWRQDDGAGGFNLKVKA